MKMYRDVFCAGYTLCHDLQSFQNKINNVSIDEKRQPFDVNEITSACYKLKPNKKMSMFNAILNVSSILFSLLCILINAITMQGHVLHL